MTGDDAGRQGATVGREIVVPLQREKETASPPPPRLGEELPIRKGLAEGQGVGGWEAKHFHTSSLTQLHKHKTQTQQLH